MTKFYKPAVENDGDQVRQERLVRTYFSVMQNYLQFIQNIYENMCQKDELSHDDWWQFNETLTEYMEKTEKKLRGTYGESDFAFKLAKQTDEYITENVGSEWRREWSGLGYEPLNQEEIRQRMNELTVLQEKMANVDIEKLLSHISGNSSPILGA